MSSEPDPQFEKRLNCTQCASTMGAVRVHNGTGSGGPTQHGRIVQTDGEAFVARYNSRRIGAPIPAQFVNIPLRLAVDIEVPVAINGAISCAAFGCVTAGGTPTRGSQQCIEFKCKRCCQEAATDATDAHKPRDPCKSHGVAPVSDYDHLPPGPPTAAAPPHAPAPAPRDHAPPPARRAPVAQPPPARRVPLAQPIGPLWRANHRTADTAKTAVEDLKTRRLEMEAREKKTVDLRIFYKAGIQPASLEEFVDTYPRLQISSLTGVVEDLKLTPHSRLDHWSAGAFKTIYIESVIHVEHGTPVLLKLRPSLTEEMSLDDCPGLAEELSRQPRIYRTKRTHVGSDDLVSPLKKTARIGSGPAITDASQAAHVLVDADDSTPPLVLPIVATVAVTPRPVVPRAIAKTSDATRSHPTRSTKPDDPKLWISRLSIFQWDRAWRAIKDMQDSDPLTSAESAAFPKVFGEAYVKATVSKYKGLWDTTPDALKLKYITMGDVPEASWKCMLCERKTYRDSAAAVHSRVPDPPSMPLDTNTTLHPTHPHTPPTSNLRFPDPMDVDPGFFPDAELDTPLRPFTGSLSQLEFDGDMDPFNFGAMDVIAATYPAGDSACAHSPQPTDFGLCAFCDEPLRTKPSSKLLQMRADLQEKTYPLPTPANPNHRGALNSLISTYCDLHQYEAQHLPLALSKGWPETISYCDLYDQATTACEEELDILLEDLSDNTFFIDAASRANSAMPSQFVRLTGYFGKFGYDRIFLAIQDYYREIEADIDPASYAPLSFSQLIEEVFVPHTQIRLIVNELRESPDDARKTLYESSEFGRLFHSDVSDRARLTAHLAAPSHPNAAADPNAPELRMELEHQSESETRFPPMSPLYNLPDLPLWQPPPEIQVKIELETEVDPNSLLRDSLDAISRADPIPGNAGHRRPTSMMLVGGYCEKHRLERDIFPRAIAGKWLFTPDFSTLFKRILSLRPALVLLNEEIENSSFFRDEKAHYTPKPPQPGEQQMSMTQMLSVGRQYASVERLHAQGAGYYSEIGYEIFMVAVRFMFPDGVNLEHYAPLPYSVVLAEVLLPEAAVRIVEQDLELSPRAAKRVLRESYLFGVNRHPSTTESPDVAAAIRYTTEVQQCVNSAYRSWVASGSSLHLNEWVALQKVKAEPVDSQIPRAQGLAWAGEVIDLTEDDSEDDSGGDVEGDEVNQADSEHDADVDAEGEIDEDCN
ncbi:hypothetical protein B0H17DRAFT_1149677 [Mycena rosella]|uniref:Restriction of telomere capping protein 4 n=1 Tax=Mycena rosella TaxID=1033263 RepID=A0AAD7FSX7_MYCRO|nr:hypothetical protein B0H17DRAFT_1149677 [Mycena rosella]